MIFVAVGVSLDRFPISFRKRIEICIGLFDELGIALENIVPGGNFIPGALLMFFLLFLSVIAGPVSTVLPFAGLNIELLLENVIRDGAV